jgi:hypothetical protein
MPWLTIIMALISYFSQKKSGASNTKALLTAGLVGAGTYYVTHETDWGQANLGQFDGVPNPGATPVTDAGGTPLQDANGLQVLGGLGTTAIKTTGDVLKSWGGTGTAAVVGTVALANGSLSKYIPWIIGGVAAFFLLGSGGSRDE